MGLYLMPAGTSSKNRDKSLDQSFTRNKLKPYVPESIFEKLKTHFDPNDPIYVWGANKGSVRYLEKISEDEYVLDVKGKEVSNVFQFCFYYKTPDTKLQQFIGWDQEKPKEKRRPYRYVYFLKNPQKPKKSEKSYYGKALGYDSGPRWLMGQRYIDDEQLNDSLKRTGARSVEQFLGLSESKKTYNKNSQTKVSEADGQEKEKQNSQRQHAYKVKNNRTPSSTTFPEVNDGQTIIKENQKGISYDDLFSNYLKNATDITVVDPYIRLSYQIRNFMEFARVIADNKGKKEVLLHLVTNNHEEYLSNSEDAFTEIQDTLQPLGIFFTYEFAENIHDRYIKTDNGWKIVLGRGLDIFQKTRGHFDIAELRQKQRKCKACEITYLRVTT